MAYDTGVYTSPLDLLATIEAFADSLGWTVNTNSGVNTGGTGYSNQQRSFTSDDLTVNIVPDTGGGGRLRAQPSAAFTDGSTAFYAHTGSPATSGTVNTTVNMNEIGTGTGVAYHLFGSGSSPRYVHCVVELSAGVFSHFAFGTIEKFSSYVGGGYVTSLSWHTSVTTNIGLPFSGISRPTNQGRQWIRADGLVDLPSPGWREDWGSMSSGVNDPNFTSRLFKAGLNLATQRTPLAPIFAMAMTPETVSVQRHVCMGVVQDVRMVSMEGRQPGETLTIGSDTWRVFPLRSKSSTSSGGSPYTVIASEGHSALLGLAYRQFA